jgi:hypothetical protein
VAIEITTFCQLTKAYHQGIPGTPRNSGQNRLDAPQVVVRNLCGFWRRLLAQSNRVLQESLGIQCQAESIRGRGFGRYKARPLWML